MFGPPAPFYRGWFNLGLFVTTEDTEGYGITRNPSGRVESLTQTETDFKGLLKNYVFSLTGNGLETERLQFAL